MTDNYDVFVEADIEDRLLRSRELGRRRLAEAFALEVGGRAALRSETMQRDNRWWHGLLKSGRSARIG